MIKYGTNNIGSLYYGDNAIGKAYYGSNLVYESGGGGGGGGEHSWQDAGLDSVEKTLVAINGAQNRWMVVGNWCVKFLPCTPERKYKIFAGSEGVTNYAFLVSDAWTNGAVVTTYATGSSLSADIPANGNSGEITAPSDAAFICILVQTGNATMNSVSVQQYV